MRVIIAGSRSIADFALVEQAMVVARERGIIPDLILSGCADGVDKMGEHWAAFHHIPVEHHAANWAEDGRAAGFIRNARMVRVADALVAVWDGVSGGTRHVINQAQRAGLLTYVLEIRNDQSA